jgi:hypothetical protein
MPRFTLNASPLLGLLLFTLGACSQSAPEPLPSHPTPDPSEVPTQTLEPSSWQLEREASGPYLEGAVESFSLAFPAPGVKSIAWSASAGKLESQEGRATWTLPRAGVATLNVAVELNSGKQLTETYTFQVLRAASPQGSEPTELAGLAPPVEVDSSSDDTDTTCDLAFDSTGTGHIIYLNTTHPSLWYGTWNGTTWITQQVDGMGYGTGGIVERQMSMVLDSAGVPHIVYALAGQGVWYATRLGNLWIRERVDSATYPRTSSTTYDALSIALDPSQGNRPTIAYQWRGVPAGETGIAYYRIIVAYRTGANAWTGSLNRFYLTDSEDEILQSDILFQPNGTLLMHYSINELGAWKAGSPTQAYLSPLTISNSSETTVSMVFGAANRLLLRSRYAIYEVTLATPLSSSTIQGWDVENFDVTYGDLVYTGGKPVMVHGHGTLLEHVTPDARGLWTYTQLGTLGSIFRMRMAVRPTTGQYHVCYGYNNKMMFQ